MHFHVHRKRNGSFLRLLVWSSSGGIPGKRGTGRRMMDSLHVFLQRRTISGVGPLPPDGSEASSRLVHAQLGLGSEQTTEIPRKVHYSVQKSHVVPSLYKLTDTFINRLDDATQQECASLYQSLYLPSWLPSHLLAPSELSREWRLLGITNASSIALWDKGMFGLNYPDQVDANKTNWNNNLPVNPLRESDGLTVSQWFGHGYKGYPPRSGDFMILPAGGRYSGDVHCNRYGTRQRNPAITEPLPQYACNVSQAQV
jgi:hypothetical protein